MPLPVNTIVKALLVQIYYSTEIHGLVFCKKNVPGFVKERSSLVMFSTSQTFTEHEPILGNETKLDPMRIRLKNDTLYHCVIILLQHLGTILVGSDSYLNDIRNYSIKQFPNFTATKTNVSKT